MTTQEHLAGYFRVFAWLNSSEPDVDYWRELAEKIEGGEIRCGREGDAEKPAPDNVRGGRT